MFTGNCCLFTLVYDKIGTCLGEMGGPGAYENLSTTFLLPIEKSFSLFLWFSQGWVSKRQSITAHSESDIRSIGMASPRRS